MPKVNCAKKVVNRASVFPSQKSGLPSSEKVHKKITTLCKKSASNEMTQTSKCRVVRSKYKLGMMSFYTQRSFFKSGPYLPLKSVSVVFSFQDTRHISHRYHPIVLICDPSYMEVQRWAFLPQVARVAVWSMKIRLLVCTRLLYQSCR